MLFVSVWESCCGGVVLAVDELRATGQSKLVEWLGGESRGYIAPVLVDLKIRDIAL